MGESATTLARRFILEIDTAYPAAVPVWSQNPGLLEFKDLFTPVEQRDSDYGSAGAIGYTRTALEWGIESKISHKTDDVTYVIDPVHAYLKARAVTVFGAGTVVHLRYYDRFGADDAWEGYALVTWAPEAGDDEQLDRVALTFKPWAGNPVLTRITNPLNTNPLPVITGLSPATGPAAGGTLVVISGANLAGATAVEFGAVAATDFEVIPGSAGSQIAAIAPAVAASTVQVKVTTAAGPSADVPADNYVYI
jgi:hypothetical protein